jgi:hypothetical protein
LSCSRNGTGVSLASEQILPDEISVADDQVLPTRFLIGPAGCSERAERSPRGTAHPAIIEPLSLDEAYLDVTENLKAISSATQIAEEIRARIRDETELSFGRRLLQQVHGMMPDILFVRFGSRRSPCRRNPPWAHRGALVQRLGLAKLTLLSIGSAAGLAVSC